MALGYETTSTAPNLIANAGNAMAASIRQTGEQIRKDILSYNQDKQVAGMLSELQKVTPESPTFQNDLIGVLAKYPMAANDDRAKIGLQLLGNSWEQKMRQKELTTKFNQQKTLLGLKGGGVYGDAPPLAGLDQNPMPPPADAGFSFGAGLGQRQHPTGVNPELPVSGGVVGEPDLMAGLDSRLRSIPGLPAKTGATEMARLAGKIAGNEVAAEKPVFRTIPGVGVGRYDAETDSFVVVGKGKQPQKWLNTGTHWENAETGETKPISMSPAQAAADADRNAGLDIRRSAADVAKSEKLANRALKSISSEIDEKERDITSLETSIRKRQSAKERTPTEEAELAKWQEQHAVLRAERDVLQQERSEIGGVKKLDRETAAQLLQEAGGDKEKARELARSRGYSL
jgi:hypothetical protein